MSEWWLTAVTEWLELVAKNPNPVHNVTWLAVRFRKVKRIPTVNGPLLSVYSMRLLAIKVRAIMNIPLITEVL